MGYNVAPATVVLVPPSVEGGEVFRAVAREGHATPLRWDVGTRAWVATHRTVGDIAHMAPAGPELLARLRVPVD